MKSFGAWTALALIILSVIAISSQAQDWPTRPIRIVVGFGPGGGTDIAARIVAEPLSKALGQPVVVENRVGAGGNTAAEQVAKGPKDGYTALMMSNAHAVAPAMNKSLRYESIADFAMVSLLGTAGLVLVTAPDFPAKDLKGVIAHVKANPGKLNFGSPGVGTTQHFSAEFMKQLAGLDILHVPYKSTPATITALIAGEVQLVIELIQTVQGQFQAGTLRAIAVTSPQRFPTVPDIPTFAESGLPGYDVTSWYGLAFPAGTPAAIVEKTNKAMRDLLATDTVRAQILKVGALVRSSTPDELRDHIASEIARWNERLETLGVPVVVNGSDHFPSFYSRESGLPAPRRLDGPAALARLLYATWQQLGLSTGISIANPIPEAEEIPAAEISTFIEEALGELAAQGISGQEVTPFLLKRIVERTGGRSLVANLALVRNNAATAALIAVEYAKLLQ